MLSQFIWWSSIGLAFLILIRGMQNKLAYRYPVFYGYVAYVLFCEDLTSYFTQRWSPRFYSYGYWVTEFTGVLIGCAVVFETYRIGLRRFPGTARMTRNALALIFSLAFAKALAVAANDPGWWVQANTLEIERVLRTVQVIAVTALAAVCVIYAIPLGKNLRGILIGYGLYVGVLSLCLTFVPVRGHNFWWYASSTCYPAALGIWLTHLWSHNESLAPGASNKPPRDDRDSASNYEETATATRRRLQTARGDLVKVVRS
jgi:hypothetical protein